jgi:uncharacterized protein YgiM (DUF1202 family)
MRRINMLRSPKSRLGCVTILGILFFAGTSVVSTEEASAFRYSTPRHHHGVVAHLPRGYHSFRIGNREYYHHQGLFYRRSPRGFIVIGAPIGAVIATLPLGFSTVIVAGTTFYYYDGVYYRHVPAGYMVVDPPPETIVVQEPPSVTPVSPEAGDRVTVSVQRLNVRSGPGMEFSVIQIVNEGDTLEVRGNAPGWLYVKFQSDKFGWVQEAYTTPVIVPPSG